jgi:hypothetical protein
MSNPPPIARQGVEGLGQQVADRGVVHVIDRYEGHLSNKLGVGSFEHTRPVIEHAAEVKHKAYALRIRCDRANPVIEVVIDGERQLPPLDADRQLTVFVD